MAGLTERMPKAVEVVVHGLDRMFGWLGGSWVFHLKVVKRTPNKGHGVTNGAYDKGNIQFERSCSASANRNVHSATTYD